MSEAVSSCVFKSIDTIQGISTFNQTCQGAGMAAVHLVADDQGFEPPKPLPAALDDDPAFLASPDAAALRPCAAAPVGTGSTAVWPDGSGPPLC
jgi:hypothetical protein